MGLDQDTNVHNRELREAQERLAVAAADLDKARKHCRELEDGKAAKALLTLWIAEMEAAGLPLPENLSPVALQAVAQVRRQVMTAANAKKHATKDAQHAHGKPSIVPAGKYRVGGRDWKCGGRTFPRFSVFDAHDVPQQGALALAIDQRKVVRQQGTAA